MDKIVLREILKTRKSNIIKCNQKYLEDLEN